MVENGSGKNDYVLKLRAETGDFVSKIKNAAKELLQTSKSAESFKQQMQEAGKFKGDGIQSLRSQMSGLVKDFSKQTSGLEKIVGKMDDYEAKISQLNTRRRAEQKSLDDTKKKLQEVQEILNFGETGKMVDPQTFMRATEQAEALTEAVEKQEKALAKTDARLASIQEKYHNLAPEAIGQMGAFQASESAVSDASSALGSKMAGAALKQELGSLGSVIANVGKKIGSFVSGALKKLGSGLKSIAVKAREAIREHNALAEVSARLSRAFNGLGNIAKRMLTRMAVKAVFNNIGQAMKSLALEFTSFNDAMSSMGISANQLTAQIVAAFSPLIETIAPIINSLIGMINDLMNAVSRLFAMLGGASTWRRAVKGAYDYSGAMENAAGGAGRARKEQEELNKTILGFDRINKLNGNNEDSSGGGGGGSSTGSGAYQWVEEELPQSNLKKWADDLASAFKKHDWKTLGATVAEGVNAAFEWVDNKIKWENAGEAIRNVLDGITGTLNSFVANVNWENIGKTVGDGLNTIFNSVTYWNEHIDASGIGAAIANTINGFSGSFEFSGLATAITSGLNNLFKGLGSFATTFKWDDLATNISNGITTAINKFDWNTAGESISNFAKGLLSGLTTLVTNTDWKALGTGIAEALSRIDWKDVLSGVLDLIVGVFTGVGDLLVGIFDGLTMDDKAKEVIQNAKDIAKAFQDLDQDLKNNCDGWNDQKDAAEELILKIDELSQAGDTNGAKQAIQNLIGTWPELEQFLNDQGDGWAHNTDEVIKYIRAVTLAGQIENLQNTYNQAQEYEGQAQQNYETEQQNQQQAQANYNAWLEKYNNYNPLTGNPAYFAEISKQLGIAEKELKDHNEALGIATEKYAEAQSQTERYRFELEYARGELNEATTTQEESNKSYTKAEKVIKHRTKGISSAVKTMAGNVARETKSGAKAVKGLAEDTKTSERDMSAAFGGISSNAIAKIKPLVNTLPQLTSEALTGTADTVNNNTGVGASFTNLAKKGSKGYSDNLSISNRTVSELTMAEKNGEGYQSRYGNVGQSLGKELSNRYSNNLSVNSKTDTELTSAENTGNGYKNKYGSVGKKLGTQLSNDYKDNLSINSKTTAELSTSENTGHGFRERYGTIGKVLGAQMSNDYKGGLTINSKTSTELGAGETTGNGFKTKFGAVGKGLGTSMTDDYWTNVNVNARTKTELANAEKSADGEQGNFQSKGTTLGSKLSTGFSSGAKINGKTVSKNISDALSKLDFSSEGTSAGESFAKAFKSEAKKISVDFKFESSGTTSNITVGGKNISQKNYTWQAYASGGFPDLGEFFVARENGPEMVGQVGNKNAVANNSQIIEGIKQGVKEAMREVISAGSNRPDQTIVLKMDGETVGKVVNKALQRANKRNAVSLA